jgi:hypothetical protein
MTGGISRPHADNALLSTLDAVPPRRGTRSSARFRLAARLASHLYVATTCIIPRFANGV